MQMYVRSKLIMIPLNACVLSVDVQRCHMYQMILPCVRIFMEGFYITSTTQVTQYVTANYVYVVVLAIINNIHAMQKKEMLWSIIIITYY